MTDTLQPNQAHSEDDLFDESEQRVGYYFKKYHGDGKDMVEMKVPILTLLWMKHKFSIQNLQKLVFGYFLYDT